MAARGSSGRPKETRLGGTRRTKFLGGAVNLVDGSYERMLSCGCTTFDPPTISSPVPTWICCGELQRERKGKR